jgi:LacI family transcriptional regulator
MTADDPGPVSPPTIADVAAQAGVSTATVSRVLNEHASVAPALRAKVDAAIAALGYVPDAGARALKLQRTGTVGAVFPTVDNAIFARAIEAFQRRLAASGRQLLIATSGYDPEAEARQAINLVTRGADALALCGLAQSTLLQRFLARRALPVVHVMIHPGPPDRVCVGFDNAAAIAQGVRYLLDLGHRRIGMLAGMTAHNDRAAARVAGVREALARAGLALEPALLVERPYGLAEARDGLRALLAAEPRPSAIVCGNDVLAIGAQLEAQRLGLAIPGALSIVGFDDLEMARHLAPALTTLHVPTEAMWQTAAERLIAQLEQRPVPPSTELQVELIVRGSTGPALR